MTAHPPPFVVAPKGAAAAGQRRYRMTVAYDGGPFAGWQVQPDRPTIQGELESALQQLTGAPARVHASGRTDTGVHARGQVAHFDLARRVEPRRLLLGLNAVLPDSIRVTALAAAPGAFHARYSATGKEYRYFIWNGPQTPPWLRGWRTPMRDPLDVAAMRAAAAPLIGEHDFAAFSANPHREIEGTVRRLDELRLIRRGPELTLIARGNGFLYRMVRSLAGFLIRVGQGALPPESAVDILASRIRTARVPTAPPQGLFLWRVNYRGGGISAPAESAGGR